MTTWWWPTQSRILVRVAAPSFSISPTARASGSRSRASTRAYTLTFGAAGRCGLAGEDAEGFDLPDAERVGVAVEEQLVGDRTDLVVERLQGQGVAGGFEVGGAEEVGGLGVGQGDVPAGLGVVLAVFVFLGVVDGDGVGDEPVDDHGAAGSRGRRAVRRPRSRRPWAGGGSGGRPGGPARPAPPADQRVSTAGGGGGGGRGRRRSAAPRPTGDMPNANANGSGVNAATAGVPSPPSDSSASRAAPPNVSTPVSAVAGCRSAQWAASWSLRNAVRGVRLVRLSAAARARRPGRGRRPRTPPGPWCSWD